MADSGEGVDIGCFVRRVRGAVGERKTEAGEWRREDEDRRQEAGERRREEEDRRQEAGEWSQDATLKTEDGQDFLVLLPVIFFYVIILAVILAGNYPASNYPDILLL